LKFGRVLLEDGVADKVDCSAKLSQVYSEEKSIFHQPFRFFPFSFLSIIQESECVIASVRPVFEWKPNPAEAILPVLKLLFYVVDVVGMAHDAWHGGIQLLPDLGLVRLGFLGRMLLLHLTAQELLAAYGEEDGGSKSQEMAVEAKRAPLESERVSGANKHFERRRTTFTLGFHSISKKGTTA
jgi:hypothetical protein